MAVTTDSVFSSTEGKIHRYDFKAPQIRQIYSIIIVIVGVFGLVGNTLSAIVLHRMPQATVKLLKYLTFIDICLIILGYVDFAMGFEDPTEGSYDKVRNSILPISHPLALTMYFAEIYLTVFIAIQRCLAVARPLHKSRATRESFMYKTVGVILVVSVVVNIPHWIAFPPELKWDSYLNATVLSSSPSEFGRSYAYRQIYSGYLTMLVRTFIPMLTLFVANVVIVVTVRRNLAQRLQLGVTTTERDDSKIGQTTAVILAITTMSIITHFTSATIRILIAFWESDTNLAIEAFLNFSTLLIMINSSTNFFLYCTFGKEFRKSLLTLCRT
ncbi:FMRFamide receptor-like [Haliotis rubra]|uniref:FMRFamide receptor-like n=1 Tax=Haliotis rubra TaxID=36100 RepID=UPI001EE52299|nr:FMRFamide receptor-like [Haliotis rubra]